MLTRDRLPFPRLQKAASDMWIRFLIWQVDSSFFSPFIKQVKVCPSTCVCTGLWERNLSSVVPTKNRLIEKHICGYQGNLQWWF